jgi:hypothetical protein
MSNYVFLLNTTVLGFGGQLSKSKDILRKSLDISDLQKTKILLIHSNEASGFACGIIYINNYP